MLHEHDVEEKLAEEGKPVFSKQDALEGSSVASAFMNKVLTTDTDENGRFKAVSTLMTLEHMYGRFHHGVPKITHFFM